MCIEGACPLPAELAAFLAERAESVSIATVRMAKAAIAFVHKCGEPSPVPDAVLEVSGYRQHLWRNAF